MEYQSLYFSTTASVLSPYNCGGLLSPNHVSFTELRRKLSHSNIQSNILTFPLTTFNLPPPSPISHEVC